MISLYWSIFAFITLFFTYIDYAFPDPLQYLSNDPYASGLSWQMASLLVMFPIYLLLSLLINRDATSDHTRLEIWVRRWALVLTLFIAGLTMAVDLITLIMYFFNGEITIHFFLKVLLILMVAAVVLMHFFADMWGYWHKNKALLHRVAYGVSALMLLTIAAGFLIIGTPGQARLYRFDEQKVSDLQGMQSQIVNYWQTKQVLPKALSDLSDSISGYVTPLDAQTNQEYIYQITGNLAFKLCATFNAETQNYVTSGVSAPSAPVLYGEDAQMSSWYHQKGQQCFARTIDPAKYPSFTKTNAPTASPVK